MEGRVQAWGLEIGVERRNVCVDRLHGRPTVPHHLAGTDCLLLKNVAVYHVTLGNISVENMYSR